MKKYTIIAGIIIFFLVVVSLLITPIIAPKYSSARADETWPFSGNVWYEYEDECPDPDLWLYIKSVRIDPPGWNSGWHYEPYNCHYNAGANGSGTYDIYAELKEDGDKVASGHCTVEYDGVHGVVKDICALPCQGPSN